MLRFNNKLIRVNGNLAEIGYVPPGPEPELYQQVSTQANPPSKSNHTRTFMKCGSDTQTGSAELAQIPSDWK